MPEWMAVDNGIVQGNPLSMLLYLFYNANLVASPNPGEVKLAYVDDASYFAEGRNFDEVYGHLQNMMDRPQGGYEWSKAHNSCFKPSKMVLMGFLRC